MTAFGAPAAAYRQHLVPGIGQSVGDIPGYIVQRAALHLLHPGIAFLIHQDQRAMAGDAEIILRGIAFGVIVSLGHEIFSADLAGVDEARAEKQAALLPLALAVFMGKHAVNLCVLRQCRAGGFVGKNALQIGQRSVRLRGVLRDLAAVQIQKSSHVVTPV